MNKTDNKGILPVLEFPLPDWLSIMNNEVIVFNLVGLVLHVPFCFASNLSALGAENFSQCRGMETAIANIVFPSDECIFLSTEAIDCEFNLSYKKTVTITIDRMFSGFIYEFQNKHNCDKIIVVLDDWRTLRVLLSSHSFHGQFHPLTKVAFIARTFIDFAKAFSEYHLREIYLNAYYVYWLKIAGTDAYELQNVLTNQVIKFNGSTVLQRQIRAYTNVKIHPLFDNNFRKNEINVSLFHCPPFVIRKNQLNQLSSFDGSEFRFLKEITKNWNVRFIGRDVSPEISDPWRRVASDVEEGISNMGMCSTWLSEEHYKSYDLSKYYDFQCATFLVPKPTVITQASSIYLPLSRFVWSLFIGCLLLTGLLYNFLFQVMTRFNSVKRFFTEKRSISGELYYLSTALLDAVNIATSHGLPRIVPKVPIQILTISWVLISLLLGTAYTTKYTSLLTSPRHSQPIDTLKEFIEQGISWGELGERDGMVAELKSTENKYYIDLANRMTAETSLSERIKKLEAGKYGRLVKILSNNFVTDTDTFANHTSFLRLMRECVFKYYSVFSFRRRSPYTHYVSKEISKYIENGMTQFWLRQMNVKYGKSYMTALFDTHIDKLQKSPTPLELANLVGAFYLLGIGLLFALVTFLIELFYVRKSGADHVKN